MKGLHRNISNYPRSGTGPVKAAARGETMVGISFMHDVSTEVKNGFPVGMAAPCEGTGYEVGSMSIMKGARNMENAKKFYDWALTPEAQKLAAQAKQYQLQSNKNTPQPPEAPRFANIKLIQYDFKKYGSSAERKRLLDKWEKEVNSIAK
jgi:iron(III) transport system substrate-binding protein